MTWRQALFLSVLILSCDHFLYGSDPKPVRPKPRVERLELREEYITKAELQELDELARRVERESVHTETKRSKQAARPVRQSLAAHAVQIAAGGPASGCEDWLTIAERQIALK
jgi:hypothetical protein